jgi:DHA1 family multidrug resistance protein-like MFS transporter
LGFALVSPILPLYVIDLGASYTLLGVIISAYGAVQLFAQIPSGRLSDRVGRKPLILLGMLSFSITAPLYIMVTSAPWVIPLRVLGGLGSSLVWPIAMALIIDRSDKFQRGRAMGWYNASFYFALAIGPAIGGGLYELLGLSAPFYFWSLLTLASFFIILFRVEEPARNPYSEGKTASGAEGTAAGEGLHDVGLEKGQLILKGYLPTFVACCGVVMWAGITAGFIMTLLPSYAGGLGLSGLEIGMLYFAFGIATALSNIYFGKVSDGGPRRALIFAGCVLGALSFLLLARTGGELPLVAAMAGLGLGSGMSNPAASAMVADVASPARRGEIFGVFNTFRMGGAVIGALVAGLTADLYGIEGSIFVFLIIAALIAAGSAAIREPKPRPI